MSGDLKNPSRSLPLGTIAAVVTGYAIYLSIPIFLSRMVPDRAILLTDTMIVQKTARWGSLILLGIWAASLSSAVGCLLAAPRTLQALARDGVLPQILGRGYGRGHDPRLATGIAWAIGGIGLLLGDINLIAPVLTMFYLTAYGLLNLSAGLEELMSNPSWRPVFRVPAVLSLIGFAVCLKMMFMISAGATFIAMAFVAAVYWVMKRRALRARWGDMRVGLLMFGAREVVRRLSLQTGGGTELASEPAGACGRAHPALASDRDGGRDFAEPESGAGGLDHPEKRVDGGPRRKFAGVDSRLSGETGR